MLASALVATLACCETAVAVSCYGKNCYGGGKPVKAQSYTDNFDDLPESIAALAPINAYGGLDYKSFFSTTPSTGPQAHSSPNVAAYGVCGILLQGEPTLTPLVENAVFDLRSFYFGCAVNTAATVVGIPTPCDITVTGYIGTREIGSESFKFTPEGLTADLQIAQFGSWAKAMTSAVFETENGLLTGTLLDDFKYTVYSK